MNLIDSPSATCGLSALDYYQWQKPERIFDFIFDRARDDSFISIGSRRPSRDHPKPHPHYLAPLPVREHQQLLPGMFACRPGETKYICINTLKGTSLKNIPHQQYIDVLNNHKPKYFKSRKEHVRELCAVAIDMDIYKCEKPFSPTEALQILLGKSLDGTFPLPSLLAKSGRGVYAWWLLQEEESEYPPLADEMNRRIWKKIVNELLKRTADLSSDSNATLLAQWLKCPGTMDTKTGNEVVYYSPGLGGRGSVPYYALNGLLDELGLSIPAPVMTIDYPIITKGRDQREKTDRSSIAARPYESRMKEIEKLAEHRKGIKVGKRHTTLLYYFSAARAAFGMTKGRREAYDLARAKTEAFNKTYCRPPQPVKELYKAMPWKRPVKEARDDTIVRNLEITREEAEEQNFTALQTPEMKAEKEANRVSKKRRNELRRCVVDSALIAGRSPAHIVREYNEILRVTFQYITNRRKKLGVTSNA